MDWLVFMVRVISKDKEWEDYSNYFGEGTDFQEFCHCPLLAFDGWPQNVMVLVGVSLKLANALQ